jgi:predicted enzyme related to lactoylglutathione lyase
VKNPVVWWEINAKDGEALAAFYRRVLEWEMPLNEASGIWEAKGEEKPGTIGGGIFTGKGALPTHRCLYVQVEDIDAVCARAREAGREILQGPFALSGVGRLAFFTDPEGHMIGLIEPEARAG